MNDNLAHRAMFALPPTRASIETAPAVQTLPVQKTVTGDKQVDAVLWLREVIATGQAGPIATALEAAKKIKTPRAELEKRYRDHLTRISGGNPFAALGSFGFGDLDSLAKRSIEQRTLQVEASARFEGESIWQNTPAEKFCEKALNHCKGFKDYIDYDRAEVSKRFRKNADVMPHTLLDCLHELSYWSHLSRLRNASGEWGDGMHEAIAREWFVLKLLAEIAPRDLAEAEKVLDYAGNHEALDHDEVIAIARNLLKLVNK